MGIFNRSKKAKSSLSQAAGDKAKKTEGQNEAKKVSMKDLYRDEKQEEKAPLLTPLKKPEDKDRKKPGNAYRVLIKPLITEKAANLAAESKYVFAVSERANKIEIAKAVSEVYGIMPVSVNVIRVKGKKVRQGRTQGKRKDWEKAIVTLPPGKTLNIYEGV